MNPSGDEFPSTETGEVGLVTPQDYTLPGAFHFENGRQLEGIQLRYETYGRLNPEKTNAILICHALSGDHHCAGVHSVEDRKVGWWNHFIGPGKAVDTRQFFVICTNSLGGCQGSTGPSSVNPETGLPYGLAFPQLTIGDMVEAQSRLMDHLGVEKLHAVIGGSMGGMQVLEWAVRFPRRVDRIIPMATTACQSAQAIAFDEVGRQAIMQDENWKGGNYAPEAGPDVGLSVARMMAHITYLSDEGLARKFGRSRRSAEPDPEGRDRVPFDVEFEVESYLRYQGKSFVNRFDANTYLYFTRALNLYDLPGRDPERRLDRVFSVVEARSLVVGFKSDWLFPPAQNRDIVHALLRAGKGASYAELEMEMGHDSFLLHAPELYDLVRGFLDSPNHLS
jgi:homoserine O-acetyltransferase